MVEIQTQLEADAKEDGGVRSQREAISSNVVRTAVLALRATGLDMPDRCSSKPDMQSACCEKPEVLTRIPALMLLYTWSNITTFSDLSESLQTGFKHDKWTSAVHCGGASMELGSRSLFYDQLTQ